ncbi:tRNA (pseudouridine54-N1)-methyltransferase [Halalkaliarchaeum desulfuricum]|uniref:tRNA (pseudouridine(54)-N(1))-methyltransferase n=1 Tax=Halalkaliarchaeum desulfuricum TaxID=2055893 RepID=A0A343TKA2_9EURY|nr:tRNA (pseudouridine54-N1)-methyltransferase [Halalkaliarchaeum desulfuricum]
MSEAPDAEKAGSDVKKGGSVAFVIVGHDAPTTPEFSLSDLPGGAGRLDLLARCVNAGLFLSHGIRENVRVHLVLDDTYTVSFDGASVRNLSPDERNVAARVRGALEASDGAIGHQPAEPSPGVRLYRMGFEETLESVAGGGRRVSGPGEGGPPDPTAVQLHEDGTPLPELDVPDDPVFVLSDHHDFSDEESALLSEIADEHVRVGPERIHADHAITIAHNYLDTDGYRRY